MLKPKITLWLLLGVCMHATGVAIADALPENWRVTDQKGTVTVTPTTEKPSAITVVTGKDGHAELVRGEDHVKAAPNSQLTLPVSVAQDQGTVTRVQQQSGSVIYKVRHRENNRFEVHTPYLVSVVKGTTFNIQVTAESTVVSLIEGKLLVYTPDGKHSVMLEPGQAAVRTKQRDGIFLKDQQSLSDPVPGSITVLEGHGVTQLLNVNDAAGLSAGLNSTLNSDLPLGEINTPVSINESVSLGISTGTGTAVSVNASAGGGGVSAGAGVSTGAGVTGGGAASGAVEAISTITPIVPDLPVQLP